MLGRPHDAEVSKNLINVRRKHVFIDGIKNIGRPNFNASLPVSVKFADELGSSEGAVDLGGPTREFLRLAIQGVFSSNAFAGPANRKMLVLNQEGKPFLCPCSYSYYTWVDIYFVSIIQSEWCCLKFVPKINLKKLKLFDHISNKCLPCPACSNFACKNYTNCGSNCILIPKITVSLCHSLIVLWHVKIAPTWYNCLFSVICLAKRKDLYFLCGKLLAISLCNGGSVGRCLAPCMYQFIAYGESSCKPSLEDVHDCTIRNILLEVWEFSVF